MINILYTGNYKVFDGILMSVLSMMKHTDQPLNIYILTADVTELNPEYRPITDENIKLLESAMKRKNPNHNVTLINAGKEFNEWILTNANKTNSYTPFAMLRLFADKVEGLPDKILYLDVDVMFLGDVCKIFDYVIDNYEIGVVYDRYGRCFIRPWYFNSGVMLMNLSKIRETDLFNRVMNMCSTKKMAFPDQSALNKCSKYKLYLPRRFNEQGRVRDNTIIQHFCKRIKWLPHFHTVNIKQWQIDKVHDVYKCHLYDDIYEEYNKIIETKE